MTANVSLPTLVLPSTEKYVAQHLNPYVFYLYMYVTLFTIPIEFSCEAALFILSLTVIFISPHSSVSLKLVLGHLSTTTNQQTKVDTCFIHATYVENFFRISGVMVFVKSIHYS